MKSSVAEETGSWLHHYKKATIQDLQEGCCGSSQSMGLKEAFPRKECLCQEYIVIELVWMEKEHAII